MSHALSLHPLPANTRIRQPDDYQREKLTMRDAAVLAMTDLSKERAITIPPTDTVEEAMRVMADAHVHMLLVVNRRNTGVRGLVTHRDLSGERALRAAASERVPHNQVLVEHVMTPRDRIEATTMSEVAKARVVDVVRTLRDSGRQHALVLEHDADGGPFIRGIFSIVAIGRQLGIEIETTGRIQSFAEIEHLLA